MKFEDQRKFVSKAKVEYKKIGYIECPAFDGEKIFFNKIGFNHLLWKGKKMREPSEQVRRINLISHAIEIIKSSKKWNHYREVAKNFSNNRVSSACFWSFSQKKENRNIRVIVRQTNGGRKYFMSVM